MKRITTTLLFATGLLALATISKAPVAAPKPVTEAVAVECCGDPFPVCPPICDPQTGGAQNR